MRLSLSLNEIKQIKEKFAIIHGQEQLPPTVAVLNAIQAHRIRTTTSADTNTPEDNSNENDHLETLKAFMGDVREIEKLVNTTDLEEARTKITERLEGLSTNGNNPFKAKLNRNLIAGLNEIIDLPSQNSNLLSVKGDLGLTLRQVIDDSLHDLISENRVDEIIDIKAKLFNADLTHYDPTPYEYAEEIPEGNIDDKKTASIDLSNYVDFSSSKDLEKIRDFIPEGKHKEINEKQQQIQNDFFQGEEKPSGIKWITKGGNFFWKNFKIPRKKYQTLKSLDKSIMSGIKSAVQWFKGKKTETSSTVEEGHSRPVTVLIESTLKVPALAFGLVSKIASGIGHELKNMASDITEKTKNDSENSESESSTKEDLIFKMAGIQKYPSSSSIKTNKKIFSKAKIIGLDEEILDRFYSDHCMPKSKIFKFFSAISNPAIDSAMRNKDLRKQSVKYLGAYALHFPISILKATSYSISTLTKYLFHLLEQLQ